MAAVESGSFAAGSAIAKFGWLKFMTLGAAALGAGMMAIFRPPQTRIELFYQGLVALATSLLFGNTLATYLNNIFSIANVAVFEDYAQYLVSVHALLGALSWGIFGGLAHLRDKTGRQSLDDTILRDR